MQLFVKNFTSLFVLALAFGYAIPAMATPPPIGVMQASGPVGIGFVSGTLVAVDDGTKSIQKIKTSDRAWATDQQTRKSGYHKITHIFAQATDDLIDLGKRGQARGSLEFCPAPAMLNLAVPVPVSHSRMGACSNKWIGRFGAFRWRR